MVPLMRSLSMRPQREIAERVVQRVQEEDAERPPAQRHTQQEIAEMVDVPRRTVADWESRSTPRRNRQESDLDMRSTTEEPTLPAPLFIEPSLEDIQAREDLQREEVERVTDTGVPYPQEKAQPVDNLRSYT